MSLNEMKNWAERTSEGEGKSKENQDYELTAFVHFFKKIMNI